MILSSLMIITGATAVYNRRKLKKKNILKKVKVLKQAIAEDRTNQMLAATGTLASVRIIGSLGVPTLTTISLPLLFFIIARYWQGAYAEITQRRKVGISTVDAICWVAIPALGYTTLAAVYTTFVMIARKVFQKTRDQSQKQIEYVFSDLPQDVWIDKDGVELLVPLSTVTQDDAIIIQAGEAIPVDGTVISGNAIVDQQVLTGESQPVEKGAGADVFSSTLVLSGSLKVRLEKTGEETKAAKVSQMLQKIADYKSPLESKGEQIADRMSRPLLAASIISVPLIGPLSALTVLATNPGFQMRITAPISVLSFLKFAEKNKILVKDGHAFELLQTVDAVVFDKTGTLTEEVPHIQHIHTYLGYSEETLISYAAAVESKQKHPVAQAIVAECELRGLSVPMVRDISYQLGNGIIGTIDENEVSIGSIKFMQQCNVDVTDDVLAQQSHAHDVGHSVVLVAINHQIVGTLVIAPTVRDEAQHLIQYFRSKQVKTYIISGDHRKPTCHLAEQLEVDHYFAEKLPEQKAEIIEQLQQDGRRVCFIGDGINDAVALKQADVSISLNGASNIAMDTAQIIMMDGNLAKLPQLFDLVEDINRSMKLNYVTSVVPSAFNISGAYLVGLHMSGALGFSVLCLLFGVGNSVRPLLKKLK